MFGVCESHTSVATTCRLHQPSVTKMREIIYIQAGNLSNYIGTHFWNTQESYFTYGEGGEEPLVEHDISFREGLSLNVRTCVAYLPLTYLRPALLKGESTYCPRLLLLDRKCTYRVLLAWCYERLTSSVTCTANFGPLADVYRDDEAPPSVNPALPWYSSISFSHVKPILISRQEQRRCGVSSRACP